MFHCFCSYKLTPFCTLPEEIKHQQFDLQYYRIHKALSDISEITYTSEAMSEIKPLQVWSFLWFCFAAE